MQNNSSKELLEILQASNPDNKINLFNKFYAKYKKENIDLSYDWEVVEFFEPSYVDVCKVIPPQNVPKRSNLTTKNGQIILLHAILHIEYSAIDLAVDAVYRFRNLPKQYYDDWLEVADDEVRHFLMLRELLNELGAEYGDIEVHNALFEASQKTQTLVERMAVVPRYLEANGLDATPMILKKLYNLPKNEMIEKIIEKLNVILKEEIDHVKKGDVWFNYACQQDGITNDIYFKIIDKYYPQGFNRPRNLNTQARKEAGFSCTELNKMAHKHLC